MVLFFFGCFVGSMVTLFGFAIFMSDPDDQLQVDFRGRCPFCGRVLGPQGRCPVDCGYQPAEKDQAEAQ